MISSLVISLLMTLMLELTISYAMGVKEKYDFKIIALANIITNPIVVYISNLVLMGNYPIYKIVVFILEVSAIITEYLIFKKYIKYYKKSVFKLSLINNIISFFTGVIIEFVINFLGI